MLRPLFVTGSVGVLAGVGWLCNDPVPRAEPAGTLETAAAAISEADLAGPAECADGEPGEAPLTPTEEALERTIVTIRAARGRLADVPAYTAVFRKQEVIDGRLRDPQAMEVTLRHEPFAVHLRWIEGHPGRQMVYEADKHDGRMLVDPGGWRARLTGTLKLPIDGALALSEARRPVTKLGLAQMAETVLRHRLAERAASDTVTCTLSDEGDRVDGRPCLRNVVIRRDRETGGAFRKSVVLIDAQYGLPVAVRTYGWPVEEIPADELDEATLIERYDYTAIDFTSARRIADAASGMRAVR